MSIRYQEFLSKVVDEAISAATLDYIDPNDANKLEGSISGLNACRDLSPPQLSLLLERSNRVRMRAFRATNISRYWRVASFHTEVEWVCNVVSAALQNMEQAMIVIPTVQGLMKAAEIVNGSESN